jgi:hypothetical protein
MYIAILNNRTGEHELLRRLAPNESIDPEFHVKKWAIAVGVTIAESDGYIPNGCADYYAETRDTKKESAVCWKSFNFYLDRESEM